LRDGFADRDRRVQGPAGQPRPPRLGHRLQASLSLVGAVDRRRRTGEGGAIRIALSDVAFSALSYLGILAEVELLGQERLPIGNDIYGAFGRDFPTRDGERVMVAAVSLRQWRALVSACALSEPIAAIEAALGFDFTRETDRFEGRDIIAGLVKRWCLERTLPEVAETFDRHGVCWGDIRPSASSFATIRACR
jgi:2-methylfumaryl-CoA isomerase